MGTLVKQRGFQLPYSDVNFDFNRYFYVDSKAFTGVRLNDIVQEIWEIFFASILLLAFSPIMIALSIIIKLTAPGPVFYKQVRVGKNGKLFDIYKFRTMVVDAEVKTGAVLATKNDPRITVVGKILRKTHLDELPQLINVLKGEMSFIGPRPERPVFVEQFDREIPNYIRRKEVKPGITGLAQVCLAYDANARDKIVYDLVYIENRQSLLFNTLIAYYTLKKMVLFWSFKGILTQRDQLKKA